MEGAPEDIGIAVTGNLDGTALLLLWQVDIALASGERRALIVPFAVAEGGTRLPAVEHHPEHYFELPRRQPRLTPEQRIDIFSSVVEPALQRESKTQRRC